MGDRTGSVTSQRQCDRDMTWSESVLWLLGGGIMLGAGFVGGAGFAMPGLLQLLGATGFLTGAALAIAWRRGGASRRLLGALAYLGTGLIMMAVIAGGTAGAVFVPLFGFVAVVAAMHMPQTVALRHVALIVLATVLLVVGGYIGPVRASILLLVVLVMAAVVNELANRQVEALEQRDRQERWRTTMVDALAHDVRSPLNLVRGVLETVIAHDDELDADGRRRLLGVADRHAARIEDLTADLLAAERVRDGRLRLDRQDVDVAELVERVRTIHDQDIDVQVEPGLTAAVDPDRIVQVLHNLLTNAYTHGSPPVGVTAARRGPGIELEVRDHGPGVPESGRGGLFGRFSQGDRPDSVGLGLWIVRALTEAHGGRVTYSDADPGARFTVWLPDGQEAGDDAATSRARVVLLPREH